MHHWPWHIRHSVIWHDGQVGVLRSVGAWQYVLLPPSTWHCLGTCWFGIQICVAHPSCHRLPKLERSFKYWFIINSVFKSWGHYVYITWITNPPSLNISSNGILHTRLKPFWIYFAQDLKIHGISPNLEFLKTVHRLDKMKGITSLGFH